VFSARSAARRSARSAESELQILAIVLDVRVAHQIKQARIVRKDDPCKPSGLAIGAERFPFGATRRHFGEAPPFRGAFGLGNEDRVGVPLADPEPAARDPFESGTCLGAIDSDDDEADSPGNRGECRSEDPGILPLPRDNPHGVGPCRLERASVGKQLARVAVAETELHTDLHDRPMLATA